jgi:predicted DNA-binding protein (MmcQ/YjbR family)
MTVDTIRSICRALPGVTEDVKWGHDLCFCIAGKMFTVVSLEHPHTIAFKCTPETFGELVERAGVIPAPYMARHLWVQEQELGEAFDRRELEPLIKTSYALVAAKLPRARQPGRQAKNTAPKRVRRKTPKKK